MGNLIPVRVYTVRLIFEIFPTAIHAAYLCNKKLAPLLHAVKRFTLHILTLNVANFMIMRKLKHAKKYRNKGVPLFPGLDYWTDLFCH